MAKPATLPAWATTLVNRVAPPAGRNAAGMAAGEMPPAEWINYLFGWLCDWAAWLNGFEGTAHTWTATQTFSGLAVTDVIAAKGLQVEDPAGQIGVVTARRVAMLGTVVGTDGANPAAEVAISNELRAKNMPKAWGSVISNSPQPTHVADGFNAASVAVDVGTNKVRVTFGTAMDNANYAVMLTSGTPPEAGAVPVFSSPKNAGYFDVTWVKSGGGVVSINSSTWQFDFVVFGKQTT